MDDHIHTWRKEDEWDKYDWRLKRNSHYISYKCEDRYCPMRKVVLKETTTIEYLVDMSMGYED